MGGEGDINGEWAYYKIRLRRGCHGGGLIELSGIMDIHLFSFLT